MITKDEILKMVAKIGRHSRGIKSRELINPDREWSLGIAAFIAFLLVGFWYNVTLFSYYNNIEDNLVNEAVTTPKYNYGTLTEVLEKYDERKRQFDEIRSGIAPAATVETPPQIVLPTVIVPEAATGTDEEIVEEPETPDLDNGTAADGGGGEESDVELVF